MILRTQLDERVSCSSPHGLSCNGWMRDFNRSNANDHSNGKHPTDENEPCIHHVVLHCKQLIDMFSSRNTNHVLGLDGFPEYNTQRRVRDARILSSFNASSSSTLRRIVSREIKSMHLALRPHMCSLARDRRARHVRASPASPYARGLAAQHTRDKAAGGGPSSSKSAAKPTARRERPLRPACVVLRLCWTLSISYRCDE